MSMATEMTVSLRLPTASLFDGKALRLTGVAPNGAFGILPNHVDFVTALVPSVMTLQLASGDEAFFGVDEGTLVKKGHAISIAVLRGVRGDDLGSLKATVDARFIQMDEEERQARAALSRLEADMVRRFAALKRPRP
jgi:F-type H+-transporting ATPase subunit epsilon